MKQRTGSDSITVLIPDKKLTRRLDALTKLAENRIMDGCVVTAEDTLKLNPAVNVSAGTFIIGNTRYDLSAGTVGGYGVAGGASYPAYLYGTIYIPSGKTTATAYFTASTAALSYAPGVAQIGKEALLLAHVKITGTTLVATGIDMNVQPKLNWNIGDWDKHQLPV